MRAPAIFAALLMTLTPGVAKAHEFVAYFDPGSSLLTPAGYQMVRSAAYYADRPDVSRILLVGHLDTREGDEYSDELGLMRTQAVATELVLLGVDPALIKMETRGDRALARPTPDGTDEPLNRRVTLGINTGRPEATPR
ncbi:OmpA family protein [Roseibacterium beibuensis]|uniref:OmpA family protein n=1 Tax=[Roseibacterium] beibuensis TaxID=1193142 RepID=UPI00217D939D|nr:OmpA family protein [Roseibacterium beibuensis]MCS6625060.1 OmpA family protein [Roseibacterium beibuensis]